MMKCHINNGQYWNRNDLYVWWSLADGMSVCMFQERITALKDAECASSFQFVIYFIVCLFRFLIFRQSAYTSQSIVITQICVSVCVSACNEKEPAQ